MTPAEFFHAMRLFGEPDLPEEGNPATIANAYLQMLGAYSGDVLQAAADRILGSRKIRKFPLPSECREVCQAVQDEIAAKAQEERRSTAKKAGPWSSERIELADRLVSHPSGRQAADEDWIITFHDFCREEGRLPNRFEMQELQAKALRLKADREAMEQKMVKIMGKIPTALAAVTRARAAKIERLTALARKSVA